MAVDLNKVTIHAENKDDGGLKANPNYKKKTMKYKLIFKIFLNYTQFTDYRHITIEDNLVHLHQFISKIGVNYKLLII